MPTGSSKLTLRSRIFIGLLVVCLLSIVSTTIVSYYVIKRASHKQSENTLQKRAEALAASLDYAVSRSLIHESDVADMLRNKIYEIADINKHDVILYDLRGNYLISNKRPDQILQKRIPKEILGRILNSDARVDFKTYSKEMKATMTSSYMVLKNYLLEPIAIVYFPYYYNDNQYLQVFNKYVQSIVLINVFLILLSGLISYLISKRVAKTITDISTKIADETTLTPIKYSGDDELSVLVRSYNRMVYKVREQNQVQAQMEREKAWREMAKQVAHEVKNPLTPMKLMIQSFERKFDAEDPDIEKRVHAMARLVTEQIDTVAAVASAFSEFAQLPERDDVILNLNEEVKNVADVFDNGDIMVKANKDDILIRMDKIYLTRILTNLISNAQQAGVDYRKPSICINIEHFNKNVTITVEDNGAGMSRDMLEKIFEPNFTSKSGGTGLGLTMVRRMVSDYKGTISVKSQLSKGSVFTVILPTNI